jgi:HEPN domain-containing protein
MENKDKQVDYWIQGAERDIETAELLINGNKYIEGLFFCHLCIEKVLKGLVVNTTNDFAPRTHNLKYLSELANISLEEESLILISILMKYQLEGRYPDYYPSSPSLEKVNQYLKNTKKLYQCLKQML